MGMPEENEEPEYHARSRRKSEHKETVSQKAKISYFLLKRLCENFKA